MDGSVARPAGPAGVRRRPWLRVFAIGLALWIATVAVIILTGNPALLPTLVLLGSFLVPVTFVSWAFTRRDTGEVTTELTFNTFLTGGVLGVLASSVLESYLPRPSIWLYVGVGLIEEAVKLAALAFLARHLHIKAVRDGIVLGASVGFGFSALESAGYAFVALFTDQGLSVAQAVQTELLRGLLAPVGHGLWTAILGGVLFSASTREHFVLSWRLLVAYLGVSALHVLWNVMYLLAGWAALLAWAGMAVVAVIGVGWLVALWRAAERCPEGRHGPPRREAGWRVPIRPPRSEVDRSEISQP